jgi:hypothetical protein
MTMNATRVPRPIWKVLGLMLGVVLVLLTSMWIWVDSVASRKHLRMKEQVRQLHAEALARVDTRPALHGETTPGDAWPAYSLAAAEANKMRREENAIGELWYDTPKADPGRFERLLTLHAVLFEHLRKGARQSSGGPSLTWENGWSLREPIQVDARLLARFVALAARLEAQRGDPPGAILKILDLLQFARDLSENSSANCLEQAWSLWNVGTLELKELVFSDEFPRQDLSGLDEALERLDRHFPAAAPIILNDTLRLGFELLKPEGVRNEQFLLGLRDYWRFGCSRRIADAEGFDKLLDLVRKDAPLEDRSWSEMRRVRSKLPLPSHPLWTRAVHAGVFQSMGRLRGQRATLRLLRVAVHYRATGNILELEDPYGDTLCHSIIGSDLKVWSVGPDGIDHGGVAGAHDWSRSPPFPVPGQPAQPWRVARDLVLQVEK